MISKFKRIHLFEIEDMAWFPAWLRQCLTLLLNLLHRLLGSHKNITRLLQRLIQETKTHAVFDLCSGSGGPMIETFESLKKNPGARGLQSDDYVWETGKMKVKATAGYLLGYPKPRKVK